MKIFEKFPKFYYGFGIFGGVFGSFSAAEKWKNNSGIRLVRWGQFNQMRKFLLARNVRRSHRGYKKYIFSHPDEVAKALHGVNSEQGEHRGIKKS